MTAYLLVLISAEFNLVALFSRPVSRPSLIDVAEAFTHGLDLWLCGATLFLVAVGLSILRWSQPTPEFFDRQIQFAAVGVLLFFSFQPLALQTTDQ